MKTIFDFKQGIKQVNDVKRGIKDLEDRIKKMERPVKQVKDSVKGSGKSFPYIEQHIVIEGYEDDGGKQDARIERRRKVLQEKKEELENLKEEIEKYINTEIKDERIRQILQFKYIDELNWIQIGLKMECSEEKVRKEFERFFKKF